MVYFWTYAHPLHCPSDLQAGGLTAVVGPMHCRSDGHLNKAYWCIRPTLSCRLDTLVGLMGLFCRSDGHFSQVGWVFFIGWMGIFRWSDGHFSQVGPYMWPQRSALQPVLAEALGPERVLTNQTRGPSARPSSLSQPQRSVQQLS